MHSKTHHTQTCYPCQQSACHSNVCHQNAW